MKFDYFGIRGKVKLSEIVPPKKWLKWNWVLFIYLFFSDELEKEDLIKFNPNRRNEIVKFRKMMNLKRKIK